MRISDGSSDVCSSDLFAVAAAAVLLGTLYPLAVDTISGAKVSVGPQYFNTVFVPLMVPLLAAVVVGPMLAWKRGDLGAALQRLLPAAAAVIEIGRATSELQSLMRNSYAVLCLKKKKYSEN